jgi:hypothetical protein
MPGRIDAGKLWKRAMRPAEIDLAIHGQSVAPQLPRECPLAIQDIVSPDFDFEAAVAAVRSQIEKDGAAR